MEGARRKNSFYLIILLHFMSMVKCSGYKFKRIDKNDDVSMAAGFTLLFHECTFDLRCNFVVKRSKYSELEKLPDIDDVSKLYNVWRKLKKRQALNVALNKPAFMSSIHNFDTVASMAVDGSLSSSWENCAMTTKELTSPWLLVDLLSEYHILYVQVKNRAHEEAFRSQPFDVRVGNSNKNGGLSNAFCVKQGSILTVATLKRFDCPEFTRGRYISFHTPANQSTLDLCELEAYGVQ